MDAGEVVIHSNAAIRDSDFKLRHYQKIGELAFSSPTAQAACFCFDASQL
jgi:hypothetical protein